MNGRWSLVVALMVPTLAACGGGASSAALESYEEAVVNTDVNATAWATRSSAPNVYTASTVIFMLAGGDSTGSDTASACPKRTQDGNTLRIEGGCTDEDGQMWTGSAVRESEAAGSTTGKTTYDKFGMQTSQDCNGQAVPMTVVFDGVVNITGTAEDLTFDVDLRADSTGPDSTCAVKAGNTAWDYVGHIKNSGDDARTWSGSGRVGNSEDGVASAETKDEVIDSNICNSEAASGTTTIKAGSDTVVITYDGRTKCDDAQTVNWSLNGTPKGELTGVSCDAVGGAGSLWVALGALPWALIRRRRS